MLHIKRWKCPDEECGQAFLYRTEGDALGTSSSRPAYCPECGSNLQVEGIKPTADLDVMVVKVVVYPREVKE